VSHHKLKQGYRTFPERGTEPSARSALRGKGNPRLWTAIRSPAEKTTFQELAYGHRLGATGVEAYISLNMARRMTLAVGTLILVTVLDQLDGRGMLRVQEGDFSGAEPISSP